VAGLFHKNKNGLYLGTIAGCAARFVVAYLVGVIIWGEYMPDRFFGMTMTSPWLYSALYNGSYIVIDMVLCLIAAFFLYKYMGKYVRGEDLL
jgi:thiamine transporter